MTHSIGALHMLSPQERLCLPLINSTPWSPEASLPLPSILHMPCTPIKACTSSQGPPPTPIAVQ